MNLKGFINSCPGPDADPRLREFFHLGLASGGNRRQEAPAEVPVNPAEARKLLRQRVAQEMAALEARRQDLWEKVDLPRLASVAAGAALDTTKDGQLRQRYQKEAVSEMVRCLNAATRMQSQRARLDEQDRKRGRDEAAGRSAAERSPAGFPKRGVRAGGIGRENRRKGDQVNENGRDGSPSAPEGDRRTGG